MHESDSDTILIIFLQLREAQHRISEKDQQIIEFKASKFT